MQCLIYDLKVQKIYHFTEFLAPLLSASQKVHWLHIIFTNSETNITFKFSTWLTNEWGIFHYDRILCCFIVPISISLTISLPELNLNNFFKNDLKYIYHRNLFARLRQYLLLWSSHPPVQRNMLSNVSFNCKRK